MSTIRAAVIGVGNMGTAHAVCLSQGRVEGMTLAALCDVDDARRAELAAMFPGIPCYASVEELLAAGVAGTPWWRSPWTSPWPGPGSCARRRTGAVGSLR